MAKKPKSSKNQSTAKKADTALKMVKKIAKDYKPEVKYKDTNYVTVIPNTSGGAIYDLVTPSGQELTQGTGERNRLGNDIMVRKLHHSIEWTGSESCRIRMIVFRDTRRSYNSSAGTLPVINVTDVLQSWGSPMISQYAENQNFRFQVLYDKVHNYDHDDNGKWTIRRSFKIDKHMKFPVDSVNTASTGGLYMLLICDASSVPAFASTSRIFYYDT